MSSALRDVRSINNTDSTSHHGTYHTLTHGVADAYSNAQPHGDTNSFTVNNHDDNHVYVIHNHVNRRVSG